MDLARYPGIVETLKITPISEIPAPLLKKYVTELSLDNAVLPAIKQTPLKFGAFVNGQMVGFVCAQIRSEGKAVKIPKVLYGSGIFVEKGFRRSGIGRILTYKLISEAKKRGCKKVVFNQLYPRSKMLFEREIAKLGSKNGKMLEMKLRANDSKLPHAVIKFKPHQP